MIRFNYAGCTSPSPFLPVIKQYLDDYQFDRVRVIPFREALQWKARCSWQPSFSIGAVRRTNVFVSFGEMAVERKEGRLNNWLSRFGILNRQDLKEKPHARSIYQLKVSVSPRIYSSIYSIYQSARAFAYIYLRREICAFR